MKKMLATLVLTLAFVIPLGAVTASGAYAAAPAGHTAAVTASAADAGCPAYSHGCVPVPPSGQFSGQLCGEHFVGTAAPSSAITCASVTQLLVNLACPATERGESISITGTNLDLTVPGATLYKYWPATGTSVLVSAITGNGGEYTKVFGSCPFVPRFFHFRFFRVRVLPFTGGAVPVGSGSGLPYLPVGIGMLLILCGGAVAARRRITQV